MEAQAAVAPAPRAPGVRQHTWRAGQLLVPEQSSVVPPIGHWPAAAHEGIAAPPRAATGVQHDWVAALQDAVPHAIVRAAAAPLLLAELPAPLELLTPPEPPELLAPLEPLELPEVLDPAPEDPEPLMLPLPPPDTAPTPGAPPSEEPPFAESTSAPPSSALSSPRGVRPPQNTRSAAAVDAKRPMFFIRKASP